MKPHNQHVAFYLCASIILLFALAFAAAAIPASAQSGGLNVLSLSKADYSWSGEVQEDAWILYITQSSSGEQIYGVVNKEDITGEDPITGEQGFATHDIEISMKTISTTCNYPIVPKTDSHIYTASVYIEECRFSILNKLNCKWHGSWYDKSDWKKKCEYSEYGEGVFRENERGPLDKKPVLACFYTTEVGTHGVLQTPTYDFSTEVIVTKKVRYKIQSAQR